MPRPSDNEYAPYYARYVEQVPETDVIPVLENQIIELEQWAAFVPPEREQFRYAAGKWSVREVIGHLVEGERVFGYRAFCISRGETTPLPSYDEKVYMAASNYDARPLSDLLAEFALVREANLAFLRPLTEPGWNFMGRAADKPVSARALAYIMAGHVRHHLGVLHTKYGV
jgi:hypothetical protein